jgi:hypothetical protein
MVLSSQPVIKSPINIFLGKNQMISNPTTKRRDAVFWQFGTLLIDFPSIPETQSTPFGRAARTISFIQHVGSSMNTSMFTVTYFGLVDFLLPRVFENNCVSVLVFSWKVATGIHALI